MDPQEVELSKSKILKMEELFAINGEIYLVGWVMNNLTDNNLPSHHTIMKTNLERQEENIKQEKKGN